MKKRGLLIAVLTGALALAALGGTVFAQTNEEEGQSKRDGFAARVAGILGLETGTVQDAMKQAHTELREERIRAHIQRLVDSGWLTPEQAEEYLEWFEAQADWVGPHRGAPHARGMVGPKVRGFGFERSELDGSEFRGSLHQRFHRYHGPRNGEAETSSTPEPSGTVL